MSLQLLSTGCASDPCACQKAPPTGGTGGAYPPGTPLPWININGVQHIWGPLDPPNGGALSTFGEITIQVLKDSAYSPAYIVQTGGMGSPYAISAPDYGLTYYTSTECYLSYPDAVLTCSDLPTQNAGASIGNPATDQANNAAAFQAAIDQAYTTLGFSAP